MVQREIVRQKYGRDRGAYFLLDWKPVFFEDYCFFISIVAMHKNGHIYPQMFISDRGGGWRLAVEGRIICAFLRASGDHAGQGHPPDPYRGGVHPGPLRVSERFRVGQELSHTEKNPLAIQAGLFSPFQCSCNHLPWTT